MFGHTIIAIIKIFQIIVDYVSWNNRGVFSRISTMEHYLRKELE